MTCAMKAVIIVAHGKNGKITATEILGSIEKPGDVVRRDFLCLCGLYALPKSVYVPGDNA